MSLIGTFIVLKAIGYSANTVSLLTVVLAIGIVVDDAIVVVENVERVMEENPELSPGGATKRAMAEITAPIIAITLVLLSVFVPIAFIPGISGELFRQFAVTVSVSFSCNIFVPSASCGPSSRSRLRPRNLHALMIPGPVPPPIRILHQGGCHPEPGPESTAAAENLGERARRRGGCEAQLTMWPPDQQAQ